MSRAPVPSNETPPRSPAGDLLPEHAPAAEPVGKEEAAERLILEPLADVPHVNLRERQASWEARRSSGRSLRATTPHHLHGEWKAPGDRPDPVSLIERAHAGRQAQLVPLRVARMARSPFAFLRGAAAVMAWDLASTPCSGIRVVIDGDAHVSNFGLFGSPQHDIVLDLNDFDEVTVGPWEWDLKRLVASIEVAAREYGSTSHIRRQSVTAAVSGYQKKMSDLASQGSLDVWRYSARVDQGDLCGLEPDAESRNLLLRSTDKARKNNNQSLLARAGDTRIHDGWRFKEEPPILTHIDAETRDAVIAGLERYAETLPRERRFMLSRYHVVDVAHRVVGIGSVGTRTYVALLCGNSDQDALFLQVKEAVEPAHAPYVSGMPKVYREHEGERVVYGQRLLQAAGDPLLGWTTISGRPFYVRQMRNMKGDIPIGSMSEPSLVYFSRVYGALLARAHARTGDAAAIAGYSGGDDDGELANALADWARAYADQTEADHQAFRAAVQTGRLKAEENLDL
ncbi:DUF2252 domain-containing protein [Methylobacterium oxalidis]|nr:DUF2252 domain-containing protein [Methylobacterium oxalidis]GJE31576.1 hypothetical protein LDDCCGHA_1756 [Methylobacterium oxalidis]